MQIIDAEVLFSRLTDEDARQARSYQANARNLDRYSRQQALMGYDRAARLCARDADACREKLEALLLTAMHTAYVPFRGKVS